MQRTLAGFQQYRSTCGTANDMNEPERKGEVLVKTLLMMIVSDLSRNATKEEPKVGPEPGLSYYKIRMEGRSCDGRRGDWGGGSRRRSK
jgi:hypothetical protein